MISTSYRRTGAGFTLRQAQGFTTLELTLAIGFLFVVVAILVFFVDPAERAREKHDRRLILASETVLESLSKFYIAYGRTPWAKKVNTLELSPPLSWKPLRALEIGICQDEECTVPGELIETLFLPSYYLTSDSVLGRNGEIFVAKGQGTNAPVYACFVPELKVTRRKTGTLYKINPGSEFPKTGILASCPAAVTWVEEDVCYTCVAK